MPAGPLRTAFAFEVTPRQASAFEGGLVAITAQLQNALDQVFDRAGIQSAPIVNFTVDSTSQTRAHPVRDVALEVAFGSGSHDAAVGALALRLADSMDHRSKPSLMMVSVHDLSA